MRKASLLIVGLLLACPALSQERLPPERTQAGMNGAAAQRLESEERQMQKVFESLVARAGSNTAALEKLRQAQAAWESYRNAQLVVRWPCAEQGLCGSVYPMCFADLKAVLTRARTRELQSMLHAEEGDACASQWPE
jgi:uncharacterized protein YecT (DUF1311 family)